MYKKFLCWMLAFALVLVSGGDKLILSVGADLIPGGGIDGSETITTMPDFADDTVLVVLTHEASLEFIDYAPADFPEIELAEIQDLSTGKGAKVQAVLRGEQLYMDSIGARFMNQNIDVDGFRRILSLKLANPGKGNVLRAVAALEQRADVHSAEPDYIYQVDIPIETQSITPGTRPVYGWAAQKIEQEAAWEIETGSSSILVGVLDSGIDITHPELSGKVSTTLSRDFVTDDAYSATQDPMGHGTHVAGIIGAKHENDAIYFSGVCQNVTLVSLSVSKYLGIQNGLISSEMRSSVLTTAINYAETKDIPLLNLSSIVSDHDWIESVDVPDVPLRTAISNYSGTLICAAGNDNQDLKNVDEEHDDDYIPAILNYANIITVGASDQDDAIWETQTEASNYDTATKPTNRKVDLFAPGCNILSCVSLTACSATGCRLGGHSSHGYHFFSGTSMATPFVTGVAALILASHPNTTRENVKAAILYGVDVVDDFRTKCVSGGRLNAYNAITSKTIHNDVDYVSIDSTYHEVSCNDCDAVWQEEHTERPGAEVCVHCGEYL